MSHAEQGGVFGTWCRDQIDVFRAEVEPPNRCNRQAAGINEYGITFHDPIFHVKVANRTIEFGYLLLFSILM